MVMWFLLWWNLEKSSGEMKWEFVWVWKRVEKGRWGGCVWNFGMHDDLRKMGWGWFLWEKRWCDTWCGDHGMRRRMGRVVLRKLRVQEFWNETLFMSCFSHENKQPSLIFTSQVSTLTHLGYTFFINTGLDTNMWWNRSLFKINHILIQIL